MIIRFLLSFTLAFLVTFGMFFWMQYLISSGDMAFVEDQKRIHIDLGQVRDIQETRKTERKPEELIPEPTPITDIQMTLSVGNVSNPVNLIANDLGDTDVTTGLGMAFVADGEYLPIVRVLPQYPARAAEKGLEGYVIVEFTVTPMGSTTKVKVVESSDKIFNRNAVRAAEKFKYKPKIVDGEPTYVDGVRLRLDFELEA